MGDRAVDVAVVGAGPAGLAAAVACAVTGLRVAIIAPNVRRPWVNRYAAWSDELDAASWLGEVPLRHAWSSAIVRFDSSSSGGDSWVERRAYAAVDGPALQRRLWQLLDANGATVVDGAVAGFDRGARSVRLASGDAVLAAVTVDASGHQPVLLQRPANSSAFQVAYGILAEVDGAVGGAEQAEWMDLRAAHLSPAEQRSPSFLYALGEPDGRVFLEETSLVSSPPMSMAVLEDRLYRRLAAMGVSVRAVHDVERCVFPMDAPPPCVDDAIVPFGAAASMVHPGTGFMFARSLAAAPRLADALVDALGGGGGPLAAVRAGWQVVLPPQALRSRALFLFGQRALLRMDAAAIQRFFRLFFALPPDHRSAYLAAGAPHGGPHGDTLGGSDVVRVARSMWALFLSAPWAVRADLASVTSPAELRFLAQAFGPRFGGSS